ncbi:MAG: metal-dependent hydrolase [Thermoguttaceae bacterium]
MAMFPTHIKCSTLAGIGGGTVAFVGYGVPLTTSMVGAGLCCIGGILPDIDSGPGIPLREITTFLASVVPTMLITRLLSYSFTQESLILAGAAIYVGIRFGLAHFLRNYTVHRGMFHSFPSMAIFGELTYLLFYGESMFVRLFMVSAVCLGFFIHLLLDEIYSVEWDGKPRLKRSFGTAMKFVGNGWWPNVTCYVKLAVLTFLVMNDPSVIQQIYTGQGQEVAKNLGQTIKDEYDSAVSKTRTKSSGNASPLALIPGGSASGSPPGAPVFANSPTVPPPSLAWPAASATSTSSPIPAAPATANWSVPADPPTSASFPSRGSRTSSASPPPNNTTQPADNRAGSAAPNRQASGAPFWQ